MPASDESKKNTDYENLLKHNKKLILQVAKFIKVEQSLVHARNDLDNELRRFRIFQKYQKRVHNCPETGQFIKISLESFVEAFHFEFALLLELAEDSGKVIITGTHGIQASPENFSEQELQSRSDISLCYGPAEVQKIWKQEHVEQAIFSPLPDTPERAKVILAGGISRKNCAKFPQITNKIVDPVSAYTGQMEEHWRNMRLNNELKAYNINLENKVRDRTQLLTTKTRDIQAILQNINQGILTVGQDLCIQPEFSGFLEKLFPEAELTGLYFPLLLKTYTVISNRELEHINSVAESCLGYPDLIFTCNRHLLPEEVRLKGDENRILELSWQSILNSDKNVGRLMIIIRDITEVRTLKESNDRQQMETAMISDIIRAGVSKFSRFLTGAGQTEAACHSVLHQDHPSDHELLKLFRNIHTLKGDAATYQIDTLTNLAHQIETEIVAIRATGTFQRTSLRQSVSQLSELISQYKAIIKEKIRPATKGPEERAEAVCRQIGALIEAQEAQGGAKRDPDKFFQEIKNLAISLTHSPLTDILQDELDSLKKLAVSQGKNPPSVTIIENNIRIQTDAGKKISQIFSHLLRNSLDHGIEKPSVRIANGKSPTGNITLSLSMENSLSVVYTDDGGGFNVARLKKAWAMASPSATGDFNLKEAIFLPGLSTQSEVSQSSGRGIGMDAVREMASSLRGSVDVILPETEEDTDRQDFIVVTFEFIFPADLCKKLPAA